MFPPAGGRTPPDQPRSARARAPARPPVEIALRSLIPVALLAVVAVAVYTRRERQLWARRRISGGRKALVLNLFDR